MAALPAFRNRRIPRRAEYTILDNTDSETDSIYRHPGSSGRTRDSSSVTSVLCDKCWLRQERKSATKRCLECKQNLCDLCARRDEVKRPWWMPGWFVHCWLFLFTKAYIPHSIVELGHTKDLQTHWAHTQEAISVQRIPRVTRSSLRSNESKSPSSKSSSGRHSSSEGFLHYDNNANKQRRFGSVSSDIGLSKQTYASSSTKRKHLGHSQSFDGKFRRRRDNNEMPYRRTRSSEGLGHMYGKEELDRLEQYNRNWEIDVSNADHSNDNCINHRRNSNKMKGKDIDIEFTDKEIKLIVYPDENGGKKSSNKCAVKKSKKKQPNNAPKMYTEQMFKEVPIWFKKTPKASTNGAMVNEKRPSVDGNKNTDAKTRYDNSAFVTDSEYSEIRRRRFLPEFSPRQQSMYTDKDTNIPYIVEEPPDNCPICLEELPGNEARALICSHVIHTSCLIRYLRKMDLDFGIMCPLCNSTTVINDYYAPRELWYRELPVSTTV